MPDTWTNSFYLCNMDPTCQINFSDCCKNIKGFLQSGKSFKEEDTIYLYSFLPSMWNGMELDEKEEIISGKDW